MNRLTSQILVTALLMLAGITSLCAATSADSITVTDAWVREVPPVSATSAIFMTLTNSSDHEVLLVGASGSAAEHIELHTHETDDKGIHRMFQVDQIVIPANGQTMLKPMSYHVMLIGLHHALTLDDSVIVKLEFNDGSTKQVNAPVRQMMMPSTDHKKMDHANMNHKQHMMHK